MKIKFNSDDGLPLNKTIELRSMIIYVRAVFHENNKYYPQVFLNECLNKLLIIIYFDGIDSILVFFKQRVYVSTICMQQIS